MEENWETIENRIKSQIANGLWGKTQMYMVLMENDKIATEALNYIEDAKSLVSQK